MNYKEIVTQQKKYFQTHVTKDLSFRKQQLQQLKILIQNNEKLMYEAIFKDFGKSEFETFLTEIAFLYKDIDFYLKNLDDFVKPVKVKTNLANQLANSKIYAEPLGNCLVIGAWNYPYQLTFAPMIAAMAAGNTVLVKPSEIAENTAKVMAKLINENFDSSYIFVVEGGVEETTEILQQKFDKIFFTGSTRVGKIVYEAAAKNLTPVTLELGGKSPAIVTQNAKLDVAAKRIVWSKFLNAGQTCVAPDYILVEKSVENEFINKLKEYIQKFNYEYGKTHYVQIVNDKNFERLTQLIDKEKVIVGGEYDTSKRYIQPTILKGVNWDDEIMKEEIFGPILPILTYQSLDEALEIISERDKPLAAYLFTQDSGEKEKFLQNISFGGGCINDCVMHLGNEYLPFGGVGASGVGNYHGIYGFQAFSHQKSVMDRATWGEPNLKYPPYSDTKLKWLKKLL